MRTSNNPAGLLASLLSGLSTGAVKVVELEIDPNRPIEDQLEEVGEKIAAAHREECPACRAEYEMQQSLTCQDKAAGLDKTIGEAEAEAKAPSRGVRDELAEKLKARHEAELAELAERHAIERAGLDESIRATGLHPAFGAPYGTEQGEKNTKPVFHEIGFMAYYGGKPISISFSTERGHVEASLERFRNDPMVIAINRMIGVSNTAAIEIRPVYDRRED